MVKIDIHHSREVYEKQLLKLDKLVKPNATKIRDFLTDAQLGRHGGRKAVSWHKLQRYLDFIISFEKWTDHKNLEKISDGDYTKVVTDLLNDKIKKKNGKNYKQETKRGALVAINIFLRWLQKKNPKMKVNATAKLADSAPELNQKEAIPLESWNKVADFEKSLEARAAIMCLFDSGARAEELLNLRIKDIGQEIDKKVEQPVVSINIRVSKTLPRKIRVPYATAKMLAWLAAHPERLDPEAPFFSLTYAQLLYKVRSAGREVLKKHLHPHQLRHSSATHYAPFLSEQSLCYRLGWVLGSHHVRRYINRSRFEEEQQTSKLYAETEGMGLVEKNNLLQNELGKLRQQIESIQDYLYQNVEIIDNTEHLTKDKVKQIAKLLPR